MLPIYERIRALRKDAGISQDELARLVGYTSRSSIARIEAGDVDLSQSRIVRFADVLGTTPAYLMGWVDDPVNHGYKGFDREEGPPADANGPTLPDAYAGLSPENRSLVDALIAQLSKSQSESPPVSGRGRKAQHRP